MCKSLVIGVEGGSKLSDFSSRKKSAKKLHYMKKKVAEHSMFVPVLVSSKNGVMKFASRSLGTCDAVICDH